MCRIYGHIGFMSVDSVTLQEVSLAQIHGGPDSQSYESGMNWSLGNNRLAIVDLDGGQQPYQWGNRVKVVFNGEIYNHRELRGRLLDRGHTFPDECDGSIIPALYMEYGLDFVRYLDGMFALALIDLREPVTLVLATDHMGIKPLYYHWDERLQQLFFSSEIPALLRFAPIRRDLWLPGVDAYLTTRAIFAEQTLLEAIRVMPVSTLLVARVGEHPRQFQWQSLIQSQQPAEDLTLAGDALTALLRSEVHALLMSDVPLSTINSGGLDSSLVTALASETVPELHTFNISYVGNWPADERAFARSVAERYLTHHHEVQIDQHNFAQLLPEVVQHLGQPNADPITLSTYALFQAIHEAGFKVAISGDGADEMFGGYDRFVAALSTSDWVPGYIETLGAADQALRAELYRDDYRAYLADTGTAAATIETYLRQQEGSPLDVLLNFEQRFRLPAYHLRRVDHLSMAHSVEVRVPYCQPRIQHFAQQTDQHLKIAREQIKRVLYSAARNHLPAAIMMRKKQPFTLPIVAMMQNGLSLYHFVCTVLDGGILEKSGIFNQQSIKRLLIRQRSLPDSRTALALWSLMILGLWMQQLSIKPVLPQRASLSIG
jgi:asparagine synthase (glutamine-hydrolysing)